MIEMHKLKHDHFQDFKVRVNLFLHGRSPQESLSSLSLKLLALILLGQY